MKRFKIGLFASVLIFLSCFAYSSELYQLGMLNSLLKGIYSPVATIEEVKGFADMGLGCGTKIGEVVGVDGKFYLCGPYGDVASMSSTDGVPYLTAVKFKPDITFEVKDVSNSEELFAKIDKTLDKGPNVFYAIRIDGAFNWVKARSEDFMETPVPLTEWVKAHQHVFTWKDIKGTMVAFRCPDYVNGIGVGGYHTHFISEDRKFGGHVFDFDTKEAKVQVEVLYSIMVTVQSSPDFLKADFEGKSSEEINRVEKLVKDK
jgi:acetolactate decarboxylase